MKDSLLDALGRRILVSDGAMGTQLMAAGLEHGGCGDAWVLTHTGRILEIHRRYVEAGADCLLTNTFGANGIMLERHGRVGDLAAINHAAARLSREAFGDREGFVIGDVGPVGGLMEPFGDLSADRVRKAIRPQVLALIQGGVDAVMIETQTALEETEIGVQAALEFGAPCVIASIAYDAAPDGTSFATMMGVDPGTAASRLLDLGVDVIALNCGTGVDMTAAARIVAQYCATGARFTMAQPNAGLPELDGGRIVYRQGVDDYVGPIHELFEAGVNIIGGCCGTTPDHIRAIRREVDDRARTLPLDRETDAARPSPHR
jgi:5-methyltetrahydrofolate--homocysteine methyltransferase